MKTKENRYLNIICPKCGCKMIFMPQSRGFRCCNCPNIIESNSEYVKTLTNDFLANRFLDIQNLLIENKEFVRYEIEYIHSMQETILKIYGKNGAFTWIQDSRKSKYGCYVWNNPYYPIEAKNRNEALEILKVNFDMFKKLYT